MTATSPHPDGEALSALMDGDLDEPERAGVDAHISQCANCQLVLRELKELHALAVEDALVKPAVDLWPNIAPHLPGQRWTWRNLLQLRVVFVGGLAAALVLLVLAVRPGSTVKQAPSRKDYTAQLSQARAQYLDAIENLATHANTAMTQLPEDDRKNLAESLALVDAAIGECEKTMQKAPLDVDGNQMLLALYEEKIRVLEVAVDAVPRRGAQ